MESPEGRVLEAEKEIAKLREALNCSRMERELLEWKMTQVEAPVIERQRAGSHSQANSCTEESPTKANEVPYKFVDVDSEIRFKLPQHEQAYETGYRSMEPSTQTPLNQGLTDGIHPRPSVTFGMSTPVASHMVNPATGSSPVSRALGHTQIHGQYNTSPPMGCGHDNRNYVSDANIPLTHTPFTGLRQRPLLVPDRYKGESSWNEYEQHFAACIAVNGWNDCQAATFLTASLQGKALRAVSTVGQGVTNSYSELSRLLSQRFGPTQQAENYLAELRHRRQGPKESLQELGQAIHELSSKAYPDIPAASRDRLERNHYIDAIESQSIREGIHRSRPLSLDDAIRAALETDNFEKIEFQRRNERLQGRPLRYTRSLDHEEEQRLSNIEKLLGQHAHQMEALTNALLQNKKSFSEQGKKDPFHKSDTPQGKEGRKCYRCGDPNHLIRHCPMPKNNAPKMGNGKQPAGGSTVRLELVPGPQNQPQIGITQ